MATASRRKRAGASRSSRAPAIRRPRTNTGSSTMPNIPTSRNQPFDWLRGYHVGGRSLMWARQSYRFGPLDFGANAKEGVAIPWPVSYEEIAPWYDYAETFAGISGSVEGLPQLPGWKIPAAHGSQLRRDRFPEAARREARPQAHHRPLRQSHRAAHAQRESAARHLPVSQPVHPRLSVRRLLQQRLGDAAVGRTHRQHDAAAEQDRLRTDLRQRQGQAPPACACSIPKPARRPTTSPR